VQRVLPNDPYLAIASLDHEQLSHRCVRIGQSSVINPPYDATARIGETAGSLTHDAFWKSAKCLITPDRRALSDRGRPAHMQQPARTGGVFDSRQASDRIAHRLGHVPGLMSAFCAPTRSMLPRVPQPVLCRSRSRPTTLPRTDSEPHLTGGGVSPTGRGRQRLRGPSLRVTAMIERSRPSTNPERCTFGDFTRSSSAV
jgi:hypothetical protein